MSLAETRELLIGSLRVGLSVLTKPVRIANAGRDLEESVEWFQALGICNLLLFADPDRFYENLLRSGHARRYFLKKSREEGNVGDFQLAISRWDSFLDTVAVGNFALAREIVAFSASHWISSGEYEDEFLYRYFLHLFISPPDPQRNEQLKDALTKWRLWLSGEPSARMDCCAALLARDSPAFDKSFGDLLAQRHTENANLSKKPPGADISFEPRARIFVEGLALLRMAKAIGLGLRDDYPMCPAIARVAPTKEPIDIFPELERARARSGGRP